MAKKSTLPILTKEVRKNRVDFSDTVLFIVQHMKENTVEFIRVLKSAGFRKIVLIGKPYSRDARFDATYQKLATVLTPSFLELESPGYIGSVIRSHLPVKSKYICFDMSGYFSRYFSRHEPPRGLLGVIEETKNGIWFPPDRKFSFPMLSVASGKLKDYGESCFIAKAIMRRSEHLLVNTYQKSFTGANILILGYGVIGKYLADLLRIHTCVSVYDIKAPLRFKAYVEGHSVLPDLKNIDMFDIIIGVTGVYALGKELLNVKNDAILINGSTGKKEFNFAAVAKSVIKTATLEHETVYTFRDRRRLHLLAHGYPVNFYRTESIPEYILDLVLAEMFVLAKHLATHRLKSGYYPIEQTFPDIEEELAKAWLIHWIHR